MKQLPRTQELLDVAQRLVWFDPPERGLADTVRFLAYFMTYGTVRDLAVVRKYLDLDDFREALDQAPPGIIDKRSWAYWNIMAGRYPVPAMPQRVIPD